MARAASGMRGRGMNRRRGVAGLVERRAAADGSWHTARTAAGARLLAGVRAVNEFHLRTPARRRLELPAADTTLVVVFDGAVTAGATSGFTSLVRGPSTRAGRGGHGGVLSGVELLLAPWLAWQVFAVPVGDLTGAMPCLPELLGREGTRLEDALATAKQAEERLDIVQGWLAMRRQSGPAVAPQVLGAWRELVRTRGRIPVRELVSASGWSACTLERRFAEQIGQPPKKMARVLRLRHAIDLLVGGTPAARVAATCGFHDQAHFSREVKIMTDLTPTELLAARAAGDASGPPLDRLRDHVTSILLR